MDRVVVSTALAILLWGAGAGAVQAGQTCQQKPLSAQTIERAMALAQKTAQALDASGAQVVALARAGQDLRRYGLRYSHMGWAYRSASGAWRVVHKLNTCGQASSALYRQGLGEFFLDDLWRYEAVWALPQPQVQAQLLPVLQNNAQAGLLHHSAYSMVSYAWGTKYQQSNQWAIETLAAVMEPTGVRNRTQAQAWLRGKGYAPSVLKIGPLTRLGARATAAHIAFDDHPSEKRFSDQIETVTADSVLTWLEVAQLTGAAQVVR